MRDKLVSGLRQESLQKRLLAEKDLTFKKAVEIAKSVEAAEKITKEMKSNNESAIVVHAVSKTPTKPRYSGSGQRSRNACHRCGDPSHRGDNCKVKDYVCHHCHKKGHLARVCHSRRPLQGSQLQTQYQRQGSSKNHHGRTHQMATAEDQAPDMESESLFHVDAHGVCPIQVSVILDGKSTIMEVDTGASVSLMSNSQFTSLFPEAKLCPSNVCLKTYTSEAVTVLGEAMIEVQYQEQVKSLPLVVVQGSGPALFGRNWLNVIRLNWHQIAYTAPFSRNKQLQEVINQYPSVFETGLGTFKVSKAHLSVKENTTPVFHRPRPIPFAIRKAVEDELTSLVNAGILEKVDHSEWAAPIVPVPKRDGRFRICGDYKVTISPHLEVDQHPLPKPEELFSALAGGIQFTKLDLAQAYQQVNVRRMLNVFSWVRCKPCQLQLIGCKWLPGEIQFSAKSCITPVLTGLCMFRSH